MNLRASSSPRPLATLVTLVTLMQPACGAAGGTGTDGDGSTGSGSGSSTGDPPANTSGVRLNEVTSKSPAEGPYAGAGDAIELVNPGDDVVDLSGWKLSDDPGFSADKTYEFPAGTALAPGGYLVLVAIDNGTGDGDFPFGITSSGTETVTLVDAAGAPVDQVTVDGTRATVSYCRVPDADGEWGNCQQTLGEANAVALSTCGDGTLEAEEICDGADLGAHTCGTLGFASGSLACSPTSCRLDATNCESGSELAINEIEAVDDRIELYNAGADAIDMSGWILTDKFDDTTYDPVGDLDRLVFAADASLEPGAFLVIVRGDGAGQHRFGLGSDGDTVTLLGADLTIVDQVRYDREQAEISFCSLPDGPGGAWTADCLPTFGAANATP